MKYLTRGNDMFVLECITSSHDNILMYRNFKIVIDYVLFLVKMFR